MLAQPESWGGFVGAPGMQHRWMNDGVLTAARKEQQIFGVSARGVGHEPSQNPQVEVNECASSCAKSACVSM